MSDDKRKLRAAVRFFYDVQFLRIGGGQRGTSKGGKAPPIELDAEDVEFHSRMGEGLRDLEGHALVEVDRLARRSSIYPWLRSQPGIGPACCGFLLAEFDINRAVRPSQFWAFAGLGVSDGHAPRPKKGEKLPYNSRLRSKCLAVLGSNFLKAGERVGTGVMVERPRGDGTVVTVERKKALGHPKYRELYDQYRHRKETQLGPCALCGGTGKAAQPKHDEDGTVSPEAGKKKRCWNCIGAKDEDGKSRPYPPDRAPWGRGDAHRHQAALRYMVKQFLADFWREWRLAEGLPVVPTYHEAMQGHRHHEDAAWPTYQRVPSHRSEPSTSRDPS
jgi:hypothetical protein